MTATKIWIDDSIGLGIGELQTLSGEGILNERAQPTSILVKDVQHT